MSACEWWVPVASSVVTLVLQALLLLTLYFMLSRRIANHRCNGLGSSSPKAEPRQPPTSSAGGEGVPRPTYEGGSSDTSSETSEEDSDSLSCPQQGPRTEGNISYSALVFPRQNPGSVSGRGYENTKSGRDYVNVDPKRKKMGLWPCSSPGGSGSVEYTEVKL